jgi:hypothetical protein
MVKGLLFLSILGILISTGIAISEIEILGYEGIFIVVIFSVIWFSFYYSSCIEQRSLRNGT